MLTGLCWLGIAASLFLMLNLWPRGMLLTCFVCFLSFVSAAQDFSGYQSDGMLLEAGFNRAFLCAVRIFDRDWVGHSAFARQLVSAAMGVVSHLLRIRRSEDPERRSRWRNFTAMDDYYQNGPLPTWIGWYVQHLPHWFHASTVYATLA